MFFVYTKDSCGNVGKYQKIEPLKPSKIVLLNLIFDVVIIKKTKFRTY